MPVPGFVCFSMVGECEQFWNGQVAVIIDWQNGPTKLYVANAGDCRSILCRRYDKRDRALHVVDPCVLTSAGVRGQAIQVSQDHTASVPCEASRVVEAGGSVFPARDGSLRVGGVIEVTRSIGDRHLKKMGLTAVPETHEVDLGMDDEFFVLASDGVWGCLDNQNAIDKVIDLVGFASF